MAHVQRLPAELRARANLHLAAGIAGGQHLRAGLSYMR